MSELHNFCCDYNSKEVEIAYSKVGTTYFCCYYNSDVVEIVYFSL